MLEAIGSHHKSKQTNTLCDISISEKCTLVQKHTSCITFAKHSNPSGELNTRTFATTNEQDTGTHLNFFLFIFYPMVLCSFSIVMPHISRIPFTIH